MTEETARWLLTDDGRGLLEAAVTLREQRVDLPVALGRLRRAATPEQSSSAWEMAELRDRGRAKFGADAAQMFFVREALEQASGAGAAGYHARRFVLAGLGAVADVCGGIGGDALAFARAGLRVTLCERDPVRALFAAANARAVGLEAMVEVAAGDVTGRELGAAAIWFDPSRRSARGRAWDPEDYLPPLSLLDRWAGRSVGVKLSPAIEHGVAQRYGAELEFLSDQGECKEGLLWTGALRGGVGLRATLLTDAGARSLGADPGAIAPVAPPSGGRFLYEPDPAVIRAHGVAVLARDLGAQLLAPQIAYLLGETLHPTPFASAYEVLERFPYSRRRLQEALTRRQAGRVVIKKRGFPQEPDALLRELRLRGAEEITVVLTRAAEGRGHQAILCLPVADAGRILTSAAPAR